MKTTDNHDLESHGYYYTRRGEVVVLHDWAEGQNGPMFVVTKFYEGEAMEGALHPSGHTELTMPYEVDGEKEIVNEIFKEAPIFVIDEECKKESEKVLALTRSIGFLSESIDNLKSDERKLERGIKESEKSFLQSQDKLNNILSSIEKASEKLDGKTRQISEAEDRLGDLVTETGTVNINKDELGDLRKDSFKLQCLDAGGVDNWEWYDESLKEFRNRYPS
jgi:hypothetical protein